ncbi:MCE family protein [Aeromicrobium sp. IC_218]|uniref:MCE family protein n=1 Tax=Aeromicrobium sp. IC_218 TaxID=2545468 RepID=UPI00103EA6B6|nr:MCE family protein [Aeromicrobium sp. IC_218]TCI97571.1 MCE family protein [Aeromicrobium sp. IC_218]
MTARPRLLDALLGLGYLLLAAALLVVAGMAYQRTFVPSVDVTLETAAVGNALKKGSDVKLNGVPVGEVKQVRSSADGATLTLALDPDTAESLPRGTTARLLPKTLFGERFVALVRPQQAGATGVTAGATLRQDTSDEAVELEEVLDELLPVLQSIQPEKLSATLGELTAMLRGRGDDIAGTLDDWQAYLKRINPLVPQIADDLTKLADVADAYETALPDLLDALDSMTTTTKTLVEERKGLGDVYASVTSMSRSTDAWLGKNQGRIVVLADESRSALAAVEPYAVQFPCLLKATRQLVPVMDDVLGKDTSEPGLHVTLNVVEGQGRYLAGDKPTITSSGAPRCPYVTGQTGTRPAAAASAGGSASQPAAIGAPPNAQVDASTLAAASGLGEANSPAENQLIAELLAPTRAMAPSDYPDWGSLLVGPTLRGTEVSLR